MAPKRKASGSGSSSSRAANLLAKVRSAAASTPAASAAAVASSNAAVGGPRNKAESSSSPSSLPGFSAIDDNTPLSAAANVYPSTSFSRQSADREVANVPLTSLIKQLASHGFTMREALPIAGKLIKGGFAVPEKLSLLSIMALEELGIEGEDTRRKTVAAFAGKRTAIMMSAAGGGSKGNKRRRRDDDETLSREWGNVSGPSATSTMSPLSFFFNEILDERDLKGRYAFVNRAPVMTAWATIVLERLGFERAEALSVAHCYVSHTSTARGISLGIIPASDRGKISNYIGPSQPHFELMGVKIPVMQIAGGQWRGISEGESVGPERAFNYVKKSMLQTLPLVMGALTLLADSYVNPVSATEQSGSQDVTEATKVESEDVGVGQPVAPAFKTENDLGSPQAKTEDDESDSEELHKQAFHLYTLFRPETGGQWGKRARFELDKVLALRKGHEADWQAWLDREALGKQSGGNEDGDAAEAAQLEDDIERIIKAEEQQPSDVKLVVKAEPS